MGEVYGPYNENGFVKATKLIDSKFIADSAKVRHILIPYLGSFRSGPEVSKSKEEAKKTADSILRVLNMFRTLKILSAVFLASSLDLETSGPLLKEPK